MAITLKETDFQYWGKALLPPKTIEGQASRRVIQYIDFTKTTATTYRSQSTEDKDVYLSKSSMDSVPASKDFMFLKGAGHGSHFGYSTPTSGKTPEIYLSWMGQPVRFKFEPGRTINRIDSEGVTKLGTTKFTRISVDKGSDRSKLLGVNYSSPKAVVWTVRDKDNTKTFASVNSTTLGVETTRTYQSSALAYPHMFTIFGGAKPAANDDPVIYYYNFETKEKFKMPIKFGADSPFYNPSHKTHGKRHEPETINITFAEDDVDKQYPIVIVSIVGYDLNATNPDTAAKVNRVYVASTSAKKDLYFGKHVYAASRNYYAKKTLGIYSDLAFTNKVGTIPAGTVFKATGTKSTPAGTPRLIYQGQANRYVTANLENVGLSDIK